MSRRVTEYCKEFTDRLTTKQWHSPLIVNVETRSPRWEMLLIQALEQCFNNNIIKSNINNNNSKSINSRNAKNKDLKKSLKIKENNINNKSEIDTGIRTKYPYFPTVTSVASDCSATRTTWPRCSTGATPDDQIPLLPSTDPHSLPVIHHPSSLHSCHYRLTDINLYTSIVTAILTASWNSFLVSRGVKPRFELAKNCRAKTDMPGPICTESFLHRLLV